MEKVTLASHLKRVADSWKIQYPTGLYPEKDIITAKLEALKNPTKKDIDKIIGNTSWTSFTCDECKKEVKALVILGESEDHWLASICKPCLKKAIEL